MVGWNKIRVLRLQAGHKYCLLGRLSSEVGWNHYDTIRVRFHFPASWNQFELSLSPLPKQTHTHMHRCTSILTLICTYITYSVLVDWTFFFSMVVGKYMQLLYILISLWALMCHVIHAAHLLILWQIIVQFWYVFWHLIFFCKFRYFKNLKSPHYSFNGFYVMVAVHTILFMIFMLW